MTTDTSAEQLRIEFVQNVSHELRTPLTSIIGFTATLRTDFKKKDFSFFERHLDALSRNSERLLNLVDDLLDLSNLESSSNVLLKSQVPTEEITQKALSIVDSKRTLKKQSIQCIYESPQVIGDARRIEQVIINLVDNAIKYIPEHGSITIRWFANQDKGICLSVQDNGPGIPEADLPRLFERFYRVDKARTRDSGGTGLGLAIVKHIMIRHGGSVHVHSTLGSGTEFQCHFPLS